MAALSVWFLSIILTLHIISGDCRGGLDHATINLDDVPAELYFRAKREAGSGDGSGMDIICPTSLQADAFSSVSKQLIALLNECIQSPQNAYYEYKINYNSQDPSKNFTTNSQNDEILFADYFSPGTTHQLSVEATCSECEVKTIDLNLELSLTNYTVRLFPYGVLMSDGSLTGVDDAYIDVNIIDVPFPVPVYDEKYRRAYISSNGLVSFEKPQTNWYPDPFPFGENQAPTLAPYWTDLDLVNGSVYYNTYYRNTGTRAQIVLSLASERVSGFIDVDFTGQWMLVGTWSSATLYSSNQSEVITFQLILISDFVNTYALYLYGQFNNIQSMVSALTIGHTAADFTFYHNVQFKTSDAYMRMHLETGNTGEDGQWIFNVSSQTIASQAELNCIQWAKKQGNVSWVADLPYCPCTKQQANQDWIYNFGYSQRNNCAIFLPSITQGTVECCYDDQGSLITDSNSDGSGYILYHPIFYPEAYKSNDSDPLAYCCENSNNCDAYRVYRPSANCSGYIPPDASFVWGDPHFETLDEKSFTFNGIGEFLLVSSPDNHLDIQIRMQQYQTSKATVIKAIAIEHKSLPVIQLQIDSNKNILLYLNGLDQSDKLPPTGNLIAITKTDIHYNSTLSDVDLTIDNVLLININDTYIVATNDGAVIRIGTELDFLYCIVELGDNFLQSTEGLLGYYDNDSSNDYRLHNGTMLSDDLTEETLYSDFGLNWHVTQSDSLFTYHDSETYTDYNSDTLTFTPTFGIDSLDDDAVLKAVAEAQCDGDYSCLYDTAQTENVTIGTATYEIRSLNKDTRHELGNFPPTINGSPFSLTVEADTEYSAVYTAIDPDTDTSTVISIKDAVPDGIQLNSTGHLVINISSLPSLPLYLTTSDPNDTITTQRISILLCDCKNNGECIKDVSFIPLDSNGHYKLPCNCEIGFGGQYCEDDLRGCGQSPCPSFTTCEDDSDINVGYGCVSCESGYNSDDDNKCVDVNECVDGTHSCSQVCTNTDGSYTCSCNEGYRIADDGFTCNDIDECLELIDECAHNCNNEDGSYSCSCSVLWTLSSDGASCEPLESPCNNCGDNLAACSADSITKLFSCVCPKGKEYIFPSSTCEDCESGQYGYRCEQTCDCKNGGSCETLGCVCAPGYIGYNCATEINDFTPIFSSDSISTIKLPKAVPKDSSILYLEAADDDIGSAGKVSYSLISSMYSLPSSVSNGLDVFTINATSGLLATVMPLANQVATEYLLEIEAKDGGTNSRKQTHLLYVQVVDTDLPHPYFSFDQYQESVYENKTKGSAILTDIVCYEENSINIDVVDLHIDIVSGNINSTFEVINNKLVISMDIDYETIKTFNLKLSCTNAFNNVAKANATIVILNINDNPFEFVELPYSIETYENVSTGYILETLRATDADHPDFNVEYFLTLNDPYFDIFTLNKTTGVLSVSSVKPFDRETRDNYTITVTAYLYDEDNSIKHTVLTDVFISIKDVNDFIPLFDQSLYTLVNLSQSNQYNDTVVFVSAVDNDIELNGEFVYSIQPNDYFDIDSISGEVFVSAQFLDRGTYTLNVYATDSGIPSQIGSCVVDIYVKATPDEIYFTENKYPFNVLENSPLGIAVGIVIADLYDVVNDSIVSELQYDILSTVPFSLNSKSREIIVQSGLNYEQEDFYEFKITAVYPYDASVPVATATVQITVEDVNDNSPVFSQSSYSILIYDDAEFGTTILNVHAFDEDEDGTQAIIYSIEDFSSPFDINATSGDLFVNSILGLAQDYYFMVTATDVGQPSMSNETIVHISVVRRGAIHPLLNSVKFVFDIYESDDVGGSLVGTVEALIEGNITVAAEHGIGFRLIHNVYGPTPFTIDTSSGDVSTTEHTFDYESQEEYVFYVELFDNMNTDTVYDSAPILVKVIDVNDEMPMFEEDYYFASVSVNAESGITVVTVSAVDNDNGMNSEVLYSLNPTHMGFHVDQYTGAVSLVNSTQIAGDYSMIVIATDQGDPQMSSSVNVYVSIDSSVQNITFSESSYTFSVTEDSPLNTAIGEISVTDVNGEAVMYDELLFTLFPTVDCIDNNGHSIIVSCDNLDREKQALYNFSMTVENTVSGVSGMVDIQIVINDMNDNQPLFDKDYYTVLISNNSNVSGVLLNPVVNDQDGSDSITDFTISTFNPEIFMIDSATGAITMTTIPAVGDYSFTIIATDSLDSKLSDVATVLVSVFQPGPKTLGFLQSSLIHSIPENTPGGTEIGVLQLLAPGLIDPVEYIGNLEFTIVIGDNPNYFYIVNANATLFLLNNFLDRENTDKHIILVQASFANYALSAQAHVTINVIDRNDNAPQFTKGVYSASISSDSVIGTPIATVFAHDNDIGINAIISYSFQDNVTNFAIDSSTGHVITAGTLAPDTQYIIVVVATDAGTTQLSSTCIVSIFVEVAIPNSISFTLDIYPFSIVENNDLGSHVGKVSIKEDTQFLEGLVFSFITPSDIDEVENLKLFHLDAVTGNVSALSSIDREEIESIEVMVTAMVPNNPSLIASAIVEITILDENDNTPTFENSIYLDDSLTEGSITTQTVILTVKAIDQDKNNNGDVSYTILNGGDSNAFTIDDSLGNIRAANVNIASGYYHITVSASDNGLTPLTGMAEVLITVYAPLPDGIAFQSNSYTFNVLEDTTLGTLLNDISIKLNPINLDYVNLIQYNSDDQDFILVGSGINSDLYSTLAFDYESDQNSYTFTITCTAYLTMGDQDVVTSPPVTVTVNVVDINDNSPKFINVPNGGIFLTNVIENLGSNIKVIELTAIDADSDSNGDIEFMLMNNYDGNFKISSEGQVRTGNNKIDREVNSEFLLTVIAADKGSPPLTSIALVYVDVLDINDNIPQMLTGSYFYISEEQPPDVVLFNVLASDPDKGINGSVTYEFQNGDINYFIINSTSGEVRSTVKLDFENTSQKKNFTLSLKVTDGGLRSITEELSVYLIDVSNDNRPEFINSTIPVIISKNAMKGTVITHINVIDIDGDELDLETNRLEFAIDSQGVLTKNTDEVLTVGTMPVIIRATDNSQYKLSTEVEIIIEVVDMITPSTTSSSSSTSTSTSSVSQTSSSVLVNPTVPSTGGSSPIGFAIAGIFAVLLILAIIVIVVLIVLTVTKRRETVNKKSKDPYNAAEENWILKPSDKKAEKKEKKLRTKSSRNKMNNIEMERKSSLVDSSAYETMFEDDMLDFPIETPWTKDQNYQADSEDNHSGFTSSKPKSKIQKPLAKPSLAKPTPGIVKPPPNLSKPTGVTRPPSLNTSNTSTKQPLSKPGVTKSPTKPTTTSTRTTSSTPAKLNPTPKTNSTAEAKPPLRKAPSPAKQSAVAKKKAGNQSSPPMQRRSKRASSIDSTASDFHTTEEYLNLNAYGSAKPMKPGEVPSEFDLFLKPDDSGKPPTGARPSLKNLGWNQ